MKSYIILGQTVELEDSVFHFSYLQLKYNQLSENVRLKFDSVFFNYASSIDNLIRNEKTILRESLANLIEGSIETLNSNKIYDISTDAFYKILYSNEVFYTWDKLIDRISRQNKSINEAVNERKNDLEYLKANRDRVTWSGYGLGGAIKAATIAGTMNAFSGMAYSVSNAVKMSEIEAQAHNLKSETLNIFFNSATEILADIVQGTRDVVINLLRKRSNMDFYIPTQADYDSSCGYLETLKRKVIPSEDIPKCVCDLIEKFPYNPPVYEYLVSEFGDKNNSIQTLTKDLYYGDYLLSYKKDRIRQIINNNFNRLYSVEGTDDIKKACEQQCDLFGINSDSYTNAFNMIKKEIERCSHFCDGNFYESDNELEKAKSEKEKFLTITQNLCVDDEASIIEAKEQISNFTSQSKAKYSDFLSDISKDFDERYRFVDGVTYDTRETADQVKDELLQINELKTNTNIQSIEDIDSAISSIDCKEWLSPKISLLRNYFERAKNILIFQNSIIENHNFTFSGRLKETDKLYELLLLQFESNLFSISNDTFNSIANDYYSNFVNVGTHKCNSPLDANKLYYKMLSHARSYESNCVNKSTEKKNIFSKLIDKTKETVTKGYQEDYEFFTQNGTVNLPEPEEDSDKIKDVIINKDKCFIAKKTELSNNYSNYQTLTYIWSIKKGKSYNPEKIIVNDVSVSNDYINDALKTTELVIK